MFPIYKLLIRVWNNNIIYYLENNRCKYLDNIRKFEVDCDWGDAKAKPSLYR